MAYSYEPRTHEPQRPPQDPTQDQQNRAISTYDPEFSRPLLSNPKDRRAASLLGFVLILIGIGICFYLVVDIRNGLRAMQTLQNEYDLLREARDRAVVLEERLYSLIRDLSSLAEHNELALAIQDEFGIVIEGSEAQNRLTQNNALNRIRGDFGGVDIVKTDATPNKEQSPILNSTTQNNPPGTTHTTTQNNKQNNRTQKNP
jgi:hypothetical protein